MAPLKKPGTRSAANSRTKPFTSDVLPTPASPVINRLARKKRAPNGLYQIHSEGLALSAHVIGPDAGLDLTDVGLMEEYHTETTLSDTTANRERQTVIEQLLVEEELFAFLLAFNLQLTQQTLLVDTDTH
jgi:hypothetical protein